MHVQNNYCKSVHVKRLIWWLAPQIGLNGRKYFLLNKMLSVYNLNAIRPLINNLTRNPNLFYFDTKNWFLVPLDLILISERRYQQMQKLPLIILDKYTTHQRTKTCDIGRQTGNIQNGMH